MKNGNEKGPSQRLQATAVSGLPLSWWHWLQNILLKPTSSVPHGCLSFSTLSVFQEGPVPIWAWIKKGEI